MDTLIAISGDQLTWASTGTQEFVAQVVDTTSQFAHSLPLTNTPFDGVMNIVNNFDMWFYVMVFFWILTIIWVIKDSNYRSHNTSFVVFSLFLVTLGTPLIGLPIYLAIRPLWYKYERAYRKAIMTEGSEEEYLDEEEFIVTDFEKEELADTDEEHLAHLQSQAQLSKKRITSTQKKTNATSVKTSTKKTTTPQRRKTPTRRTK